MGNLCSTYEEPMKRKRSIIKIPSFYDSLYLNIHSFIVNKVLAKRTLGKILLVTKRDSGELFALKTVKKSKLLDRKTKKHALSERNVLASVKSDFIVKLHFAFQNSEKLYLVLDYMPGGDLFYHFKQQRRFSVHTACFYIAEVILALEDLHAQHIIYRDLKLENILLAADGHIKLADFNLAKVIDSSCLRSRTICGTPEYLSPEVIKGNDQTFKVDYWSLGILLYEMIEGVTPFYAKSQEELFNNIMKCNIAFTKYTPDPARKMIESLLKISPLERPKSVSDIKSFEFFDGINWAELRTKSGRALIIPKTNDYLQANFCKREGTEDSQERSQPSQGNEFKDFTYIASPYKFNNI